MLSKEALMVNPYVLRYQVPGGGMYSNLIAQLKEMRALDKLDDVLNEIPRVREDLGWPPLVTPTSQIVGTQAVLNVLFGRYERITEEVKNYIRGGLYGRPPEGGINPELKRRVLGGEEEPIGVRPGELLEPRLEKCRRELEELGYLEKEEDVLTYCLFPQVAKEFFEARKRGRKGRGCRRASEVQAPHQRCRVRGRRRGR